MWSLLLLVAAMSTVSCLDTRQLGINMPAFSGSFRPAPMVKGRGVASLCSKLKMAGGGFGQQQQVVGNRDQRRGAKKAGKEKAKAAANPKTRGMQNAGEVLADSLTPSGPPQKIDRPAALEQLRSEAARRREDAIKGKASKNSVKAPRGLPLEDEVCCTCVQSWPCRCLWHSYPASKASPHINDALRDRSVHGNVSRSSICLRFLVVAYFVLWTQVCSRRSLGVSSSITHPQLPLKIGL